LHIGDDQFHGNGFENSFQIGIHIFRLAFVQARPMHKPRCLVQQADGQIASCIPGLARGGDGGPQASVAATDDQ